MKNVFPQRLRSLREAEGQTQANMARLLNVQRSTYGEYERGAIMPPISKLSVLADHFHVSVDYLTGNSDIVRNKNETTSKTDVGADLRKIVSLLESHSSVTFDGKDPGEKFWNTVLLNLNSIIQMSEIMSS